MMAFFGLLYLLPICLVSGRAGRRGHRLRGRRSHQRFVGPGLASATRRFRRELKPRDGFMLVSLRGC
jgi:hypothetical protein